ncbi:TRAP transporter large permease [Arenibacterium sp. LLYu02]|uniref:TRAP transporter large permease n=1 Tax=Arenibacterium sp. LLYu02 TaxID=3404132 RepID=UPI003B2169C6
MEWYNAFIFMVGMILVLMIIRIPVAFAFLIANVVGVIVFMGGHFGIVQLTANATDALTNYSLVPIPLFLLMGELFFQTGIATRVFSVIDRLMGGLRGRLSYVTIAGGTIFSALSGSSLGNVAMMGSTLYPEMERNNYSRFLSLGPIVATGGLAAIIPPSGLAVVLGSIAGIDVGRLLLAGVVPGVGLALAYAALVFFWTVIRPEAAPLYEVAHTPLREKVILAVTNLLPMGIVVFMVVGLIILGIATPTESAAFGVVSVLILAAFFRCLTIGAIVRAAAGAMRISGMILLIILASSTFSQILSISGATRGLIAQIQSMEVGVYLLLFYMGLVLAVLGAFLDPVGIMMLTIPVFLPLAASYGIDPIWMGIFILIFIEFGLATPPFGLALYVMMGAARNRNIIDISVSVAPFLLITLIMVVIITIYPEIVLYLPSLIVN